MTFHVLDSARNLSAIEANQPRKRARLAQPSPFDRVPWNSTEVGANNRICTNLHVAFCSGYGVWGWGILRASFRSRGFYWCILKSEASGVDHRTPSQDVGVCPLSSFPSRSASATKGPLPNHCSLWCFLVVSASHNKETPNAAALCRSESTQCKMWGIFTIGLDNFPCQQLPILSQH